MADHVPDAPGPDDAQQPPEPALRSLHFRPLPPGRVRPLGWLAGQLRLQADAITGPIEEFWPDIRDSGWIGGGAEGWERAPYWLDGLVPLAYALDDPWLKAKVSRWVEYILAHQQPDGWLGPEQSPSRAEEYQPRDPWPVYVAMKALTQVCDATNDPRIPVAIERFLACLSEQMDQRPLYSWNQFRWQDLVLTIHWLYDRTGAPWLLELAAKARAQGYDWIAHFESFPYPERVLEWRLDSHVVNHGMAVKTAGVWWRQSGEERDLLGGIRALETLDRYHGQCTGIFTGDECLAGPMPSQGTELCAVVELMFSLEVLLAVHGDARLGDRLERIAFNALPAQFLPDMHAHQYVQQANQVLCRVSEDRVYATNGPEANLFGLEPNYGCCTANQHQGWPKFAAHLWMELSEGGLAAVAYAPSRATTRVGGAEVTVTAATAYPFDDTIDFEVACAEPVAMPIVLRVPAWATEATIELAGAAQSLEPGRFHRFARTWTPGERFRLRLPMRWRVERRFAGAVTLHRGPLVYSHAPGEWRRAIRGEAPYQDWEVYPTTQWNYGAAFDLDRMEEELRITARRVLDPIAPDSEGPPVFSPEGAPIRVEMPARLTPEWVLERNAAAPPPAEPSTDQPIAPITLMPYGCTNLRVTEFPWAANRSSEA